MMIKLNPENLIDRIIALWQTEDILRANQFNVKGLSEKRPELGKIELEWLQQKADEMRDEGILESGHLKEANMWLVSFENAEKEIDTNQYETLRETLSKHPNFNKHSSHIQTGFEILYGYYLKRIEGTEFSKSIEVLARAIGEYLNELSLNIKDENLA